MNELSEEELNNTLTSDPGSPLFVELAERLINRGEINAALPILLRGLSSSPNNHCGRLALAKAFYETGAIPYAAREIEQLIGQVPECSALKKLLNLIAPKSELQEAAPQTEEQKQETESTIAEAEFDFAELDIVATDQKKN